MDGGAVSPFVRLPRPRGRVFGSLLELIGATPLVRLDKFAQANNIRATLLGKMEFFNPLFSVKDRIALSMVEAAEQDGRLKPGGTLIEPTCGNTAIALAFVAAVKGYRLILTMPESLVVERRKMLVHLGAEIVLTPVARGMNGALLKAKELARTIAGALLFQQFDNAANLDAHRRTTAVEIWEDTQGAVDGVVAGVGTGGTLCGIAEHLKALKPSFKAIAVEPDASAVLSGCAGGSHKIQGIGPGFIPRTLKREVIDQVVRVSDDSAFVAARQVARIEGVPAGISAGAALAAAVEIGAGPEWADKTLVVIIPSGAERYLSGPLFD